MIKEFSERWNKYKGSLEEYFRNTKQEKEELFLQCLEKLYNTIILLGYENYEDECRKLISDNMEV